MISRNDVGRVGTSCTGHSPHIDEGDGFFTTFKMPYNDFRAAFIARFTKGVSGDGRADAMKDLYELLFDGGPTSTAAQTAFLGLLQHTATQLAAHEFLQPLLRPTGVLQEPPSVSIKKIKNFGLVAYIQGSAYIFPANTMATGKKLAIPMTFNTAHWSS